MLTEESIMPAPNYETSVSSDGKIKIENRNVLDAYDDWEAPIVIISDGPYGIGGFPKDLPTYEGMDKWYEPHIKKWSEKSTPQTTLWFWCNEIGWATVHHILEKYGWKYINCHIWNKGLSHVAGRTNTKTLRKLPMVSEICVQYSKDPTFRVGNDLLNMKEWLRSEWKRTSLPFSKTNEAANVKNAATRKYFTKCHLWYPPTSEAFEKISIYANKYGDKKGIPYFSIDGKKPLSKEDWEKLRPKFNCPIGVTNVWTEPPLNGHERIKIGSKSYHLNQKPIKFMELIIETSSEEGDLIWEPFGGLCTAALASQKLNRRCNSAEIENQIYNKAIQRFLNTTEYTYNTPELGTFCPENNTKPKLSQK